MFAAETLPYISAEFPATGGSIKQSPEHFVVEEIPLYEPAGDGPHLYLTIRRKGLGTREVVEELAGRYRQAAGAIGYAGLKDKDALTTQTFSLPIDLGEDQVRAQSQGAPWEVLAVSRHRNKLKIGHLLGNKFTVLLTDPQKGLAEAQALGEYLKIHGLPNYFGGQRFGRGGDNAEEGLRLLQKGRGGKSWKSKFLLSALQSSVFNHYLGARIKAGLFEKILTGDVCKKYATGGLFVSEDGEAESKRLLDGELSHTGPIWGAKMKAAAGPAAELEARALGELSLSQEMMAKAGSGDRRLGRLLLPTLDIKEADGGNLIFSFALPKGAYATSVMREFLKS